MARRLGALAAVLLTLVASGCNSATPAATPSPALLTAATTASAAATAALATPTTVPSVATAAPTVAPTAAPTATPLPTASAPAVTVAPTAPPTQTAAPTAKPTPAPTRTLKPGETPRPTPLDIASFLVSEIIAQNLGTASIAIDVALDDGSGSATSVTTETLEAGDLIDQQAFEGDYVITFRRPTGSAKPVLCNVTLKEGDVLSFYPLDDSILVALAGVKPVAPGDIFVATSPVCGH